LSPFGPRVADRQPVIKKSRTRGSDRATRDNLVAGWKNPHFGEKTALKALT
jgi:hypothetical protein